MTDDSRAQLRYARLLLERRRYRELAKRTLRAAHTAVARLFGPTDEDAYLRYLGQLERTDAKPPAGSPAAEAPLVSLLLPGGAPSSLQKTIESVVYQTYGEWELLLDQPTTLPTDERVRAVHGRRGPAALLEAARGALVALVSPGDRLLPHALEILLEELWLHPDAGLVYSDEGLLDEAGAPLRPRFKPDWSPDLLLELPYTGQLSLFRRSVVDRAGGLDPALSPAAALYDLTLRATEQARAVHLPELLVQRLPERVPVEERTRVVRAALERRGLRATVKPTAGGEVVVRRRIDGDGHPSVAIVVPFKNRVELLRRCVESIRRRSSYRNYQILAVDNGSDEPATLDYLSSLERSGDARIVRYPRRFNFAAMNNFAAAQTEAEHLLLLNNDTEVASADWIEALVEHAQRPEVGMVGARLSYPDGRLQHAGVVLGLAGLAGHPFDGWPDGGDGARDACGHGGEVACTRDVSAVTAACAMIRRQLYLEVGGMDAVRFPVSFNDVDLCLRLRARGLFVIYTPHCRVIHHTSASRGRRPNLDDDDNLIRRWGPILDKDPYYSPQLSLRTAYRPRYCERVL